MADQPKDKDAKKDEGKKPEVEAPAKKKPPIKMIGIIAALMLIEGVAVYMLIGMTSPQPAAAEVEIHGHEQAEHDSLVEIPLVEEKVFQNLTSGRTWNWTISIVLRAKQKHAGHLEEEMATREAEIQEGLARIIAKAQLAQLQDPDLRVIQRQIGDFLKTIFEADIDGHSRIERILIPTFTGQQRNF